MDIDERYYPYSKYLKKRYGEKVYKLPVNLPVTCPNRISGAGCSFCAETGTGFEAMDSAVSVTEQLMSTRKYIEKRYHAHKFIAYFQSYTNTYAPVSYLKKLYFEAIEPEEIVALSIGTRSDCLSPDILDLLSSVNQTKAVWMELGMQTMHNETLDRMNTHTTVEEFDASVYALAERGIPVIAHVILGLPGETRDMMLATIRHVAGLPVSGVKLQLLHVLDHTALADMYRNNPFPVMELNEYCELVIDCLELLPPDLVIHRLTGDGPRNLLLAPRWSTDKKRVLNTIHRRMKERNTWQGKYYKS